jgi:hypothetical protein
MSTHTTTNPPLRNEYPDGMNSLSIEPLYLEIFSNENESNQEQLLGHGTAFLIDASPNRSKCDDRRTLKFTTAGHCLTGKNFFHPNQLLDKQGRSPTFVRIHLPKRLSIGWDPFDVALLDGNHKPTYQIIKHKGMKCDIATFELECTVDFGAEYHLALPDPMCFRRHPFNKSTDWMLDSVGCDQLLISGFPLSRKNQKFALTIPAVIASEPRFPFEFPIGQNNFVEYPFFLVSARTWTGQSGSPVYRSASAGFGARPEGWLLAAGGTHNIVGIYTSRLHPNIQGIDSNQHSDLGVVWPLNLLVDAMYERCPST